MQRFPGDRCLATVNGTFCVEHPAGTFTPLGELLAGMAQRMPYVPDGGR